MSEQLVKQGKNQALLQFNPRVPIEQQLEAAQYLIDSGLMPSNITEPAQVLTVTQMGYELGIKPLVALNNINVIKGKPVIGAAVIGSMLQRAGYEYAFTKDWLNEGTDEKPK